MSPAIEISMILPLIYHPKSFCTEGKLGFHRLGKYFSKIKIH